MLNIPKSTCNNIYRHAVNNLQARNLAARCPPVYANAGEAPLLSPPIDERPASPTLSIEPKDLMLVQLLAPECLDADKRIGRPQWLSPAEKARLIEFVRESWDTRRMSIVDIQCRAGLGHASRTTIHKALAEAGIKAYIEEFKFILDEDNMLARYVYFYYLSTQLFH